MEWKDQPLELCKSRKNRKDLTKDISWCPTNNNFDIFSHDITRYYNILLRIMHRATGPTIGLHPRETFEIKDSVTCAQIPWDEKNTPKKSNQGL